MPPDNSGYLYAAYTVAAVIYLGYAVSLIVRARRAARGLPPSDHPPA
jgi:hypothetical protein